MAVPVTAENFTRAESDHYLTRYAARGVNVWTHIREPTPIDAQDVIRMNRDTLYSIAVADISAGATLTLPEAGGRYQTAMIVNQDHYINRVYDRPGTYELAVDEFDTPWVAVAVRTLVDAADPADIAAVNALQDALVLEAGSATPFQAPEWDEDSLTKVRNALLVLAEGLPDTIGVFGAREDVDPIRHLIGTAYGWGGLPADQAFYLPVTPGLPVGHYALTVRDVPVRAFWSVSVYDAHGYFVKNDLGRYTVNSVTAEHDADGAVTVNFGGDPSLPNHVPVMEGWNYTVRLYQPDPQILDGTWRFPTLAG